ncbi:MAG: MerC domain-containing protein [Pseudomonadota bacterium]
MRSASVDATGMGLSGLCIVHCLVLPVMLSTLPVLAPVAESELVHKALVVLVIPVCVIAFLNSKPGRERIVFGLFAALGAALLVVGAFVEAFEDYETPLTVAGALLLVCGHAFRWLSRHKEPV